MKQKHEFENIVAETLLIPLYMRAKENRRKNPILCDKLAEQLLRTSNMIIPGSMGPS